MSFYAMLCLGNCTLHLISDQEMISMVDVLSVVVSMISTPHPQANNPNMAAFDAGRPTSYLIYLDANIL